MPQLSPRKAQLDSAPAREVDAQSHQPATETAGQSSDAAIRRMAGPQIPGVDNPEQLARDSLFSADASVTALDGQELYHEGHVRVRFDPNTRFSVRLDPGGLHLSADPGIEVDVPGPNLRISSIGYDFQAAKFHAYGKASFDLFGAYASIAMGVVERALEKKVKPLLPSRIQQPGYSMARDPNLQETVQQLQNTFQFAGGGHAATQQGGRTEGGQRDGGGPPPEGGAAGGGVPGLSRLVDPSAFAVLQAPRDLHIPLGTEQLELYIHAGALLDISVDGSGPMARPKLKQLSLTSPGSGIEIQSTGKGLKDAFMGLTMKRIGVGPGGKFDFDYDLRPEEMGRGLLGLVALLGMAAGEHVGSIPDVKMQGVRKELDERLQREVPPRLKAFLGEFDHILPGFSLLDIFGM